MLRHRPAHLALPLPLWWTRGRPAPPLRWVLPTDTCSTCKSISRTGASWLSMRRRCRRRCPPAQATKLWRRNRGRSCYSHGYSPGYRQW
ncbi:MAG: hypothetical protein E5V45_14750 [Mesorhizobium sp.]|nr:MAG: hypothetical protein E5V45_14750 [Mesorhizobium sp.]